LTQGNSRKIGPKKWDVTREKTPKKNAETNGTIAGKPPQIASENKPGDYCAQFVAYI